jgi:xylose dehydrogenase (NAD/NADP)
MVLHVGILSTAKIARKNILAMQHEASAKVVEAVCVGSRDAERARKFAEETGVLESYGSYNQVLASPAVDAVYVPLPTALHAEWVAKAAAAGKHVLCEKPVARTTAELVSMLQALAERDLVFMDGSACVPLSLCVRACACMCVSVRLSVCACL